MALMLGVVVSVGYWHSTKKAWRANTLILQNVEALANDESDYSNMVCINWGSVDCPMDHTKAEKVYWKP